MLVLLAGALVGGIVIEVTGLTGHVDSLGELDLNGVNVETTGLEEVNLTALLPLVQIFMGKAVALEKIELPKATQETVGELSIELPPGWEIAVDEDGEDKTYQTNSSTVVMLEDQDGNFAVISTSKVADPDGFLSDTMNQHANLLEISGFEINAYTIAIPRGRQALAIDVLQDDLAIQIRGWVYGTEVSIITLTSHPDDLAVSEQVFGSIA